MNNRNEERNGLSEDPISKDSYERILNNEAEVELKKESRRGSTVADAEKPLEGSLM